MNYSHHYYKLGNRVYTTIRKSKKPNQKVGTIELEYFNNILIHKVEILRIERVILDKLNESLLIMDCLYPNSKIDSRENCYELFKSFYVNEIDFSTQIFYLFLLKKVKNEIKIGNFIK